MTTSDPLLERLRQLPRPALDDVAAARTQARAETAFGAPQVEPRPRRARAWIPAALALWGALYAFGAVRELGRIYPASMAQPAVAVNHRGPANFDDVSQFMLKATSNASARTTIITTIVPPRPDTLRATSRSNAVPVCSDVSSDMDPSMQVVACDTPDAETFRLGAGRGTYAAPTAAPPGRAPHRPRARAPSGRISRRDEA